MAALQPVTDASFASVVLASPTPVLVDYWADWCAPCRQLTPVLEELAHEYEGKVTFVSMDTNENTGIPTQQGVLSLPTVQIFVNGEVATSFQGGKTKMALRAAIDDCL